MLNFNNKQPPGAYKTERLTVMRHERTRDAEPLFEAARESIPHVFPFLPWCHPDYSIEESVSWLDFSHQEWRYKRSYGFSIYETNTERFIGGIGLSRIDDHPVANLGYWIRSSALNQGYATEATKGLIEFGFNKLGLQRIEIIMSVKNDASRKVAEAAGGEFEGTLKKRLLLHAQAHDAYLYSVTR